MPEGPRPGRLSSRWRLWSTRSVPTWSKRRRHWPRHIHGARGTVRQRRQHGIQHREHVRPRHDAARRPLDRHPPGRPQQLSERQVRLLRRERRQLPLPAGRRRLQRLHEPEELHGARRGRAHVRGQGARRGRQREHAGSYYWTVDTEGAGGHPPRAGERQHDNRHDADLQRRRRQPGRRCYLPPRSRSSVAPTPEGALVQTRNASIISGSWSVDASPALPEGTYTARAEQQDAAGNLGLSSANTFAIGAVDEIPPIVTLVQPADGRVTNDATPTFGGVAGTVPGDLPAVTVNVYLGSTPTGSPIQTLLTSRDGSGNYAVDAAPALSDGLYTARSEQRGRGGEPRTERACHLHGRHDAPPLPPRSMRTRPTPRTQRVPASASPARAAPASAASWTGAASAPARARRATRA